jgi:hypothetical protein
MKVVDQIKRFEVKEVFLDYIKKAYGFITGTAPDMSGTQSKKAMDCPSPAKSVSGRTRW